MLRSALPRHLRPRREKVFGDGPRIPLDREAKVRIMHLARALKQRTEPRRHYGQLTGKFVDVLHAMLWLIHDGKTGQCNPAYGTIADKAGCAPSTVGEAIHALENAGILSWVNRICRIATRERDLFGHWVVTRHVVRTSNAYVFHDPKMAAQRGRPSNTEFRREPPNTNKNPLPITSYPQPHAVAQKGGARLAGAQVIRQESLSAPPTPAAPPQVARQNEHSSKASAKLSPAERAALIRRLDTAPTKADWALYSRMLDEMLGSNQ